MDEGEKDEGFDAVGSEESKKGPHKMGNEV